jgi:hypothetical protein
MINLQETIDQRAAVLGKALCWLRLVRGIPTLLEADRLYRQRVRPAAAPMEFGSRVSRYERDLGQPGQRMMIEMLALYGVDFRDLETSLEVMSKAKVAGPPTLRRALAKGSALHADVVRLVDSKSLDDRAFKELVVSCAEMALAR